MTPTLKPPSPRPRLTGRQVILVRAAGELRAWSQLLEEDSEGDEGREALARELKRIGAELWNLADDV